MKSMIKPILGGIFLGALLFFAGPFILIVLLLKFIFTPFGMGRMMHYNHGAMYPGMRLAMANKIRSMSDEEFNAFKEKMNFSHSHCHNRYHNTKTENNEA